MVAMAIIATAIVAQAKVIHLNNGNTVNAEVVSETSTTLTVKLANGDTRTYNKVEILKIEDENSIQAPDYKKQKYVEYADLQKGFWGAIDLGAGVNPHLNSETQESFPIELLLTAGYRFNKYIQLGVGGGFRYYIGCNSDRVEVKDGQINENGHWSYPVYVNARGIFINDHARYAVPFWSANVGYTVLDGFYCSPTLGYRFGSTERNHFLLGLSYTAQQCYLRAGDNGYTQGFVHGVSLKFGYQF